MSLNQLNRKNIQDFLFGYVDQGKNRTAQKTKILMTSMFDVMVDDYPTCLTVYAYKSMQKVKESCAKRVEMYYKKYPFDKYGEKHIKRELFRLGIVVKRGEYADCYDAGMLAYLYSLHRCAALNCDYAPPYIKKMIQIYI